MTKAGFVALVGRPNSGKSTLLNQLIGEKVSIVSDKPQTTRNRIIGILNRPETQIILVDTPGIHRPGHRMNERMMHSVYDAMREVDIVVHLVDASKSFGKGEQYVLDLVKKAEKPAILALNKIDLINKGKLLPQMDAYSKEHDYVAIIPISALTGNNTEDLIETVASHLPEHEFLYPPDYLTDQQERGMVSELIREKVLSHTREELPYSTAVKIEEFEESEREKGFVRISASIIVDKDSQKKIVIGRGGQMIKAIGTEARGDIQDLLQVPKVFLELNVKVVPGWRDQEHLLDEIGMS